MAGKNGKNVSGNVEVSEVLAQSNDEDSEGLSLVGYDVILCGTGLVHSILASALSLAGKSVLHCDGRDYYGEGDCSMDLRSMLEWAKVQTSKCGRDSNSTGDSQNSESEQDGTLFLSSEGSMTGLIIHSCSNLSNDRYDDVINSDDNHGMLPSKTIDGNFLSGGKGQNSSAITSKNLTMFQEGCHDNNCESNSSNEGDVEKNDIKRKFQSASLDDSRRFVLDLTPQGPLLLANHSAVSALVSSNVADYVEFKMIEKLSVLLPEMKPGKQTTVDRYTFQNVPCSKGDVFQSQLLTPLEKRKLMKFLQLILDYGVSASVKHTSAKAITATEKTDENSDVVNKDDVVETFNTHNDIEKEHQDTNTNTQDSIITSLNERHLKQGRSLSRPQNKTVATSALDLLQTCMDDPNMSFVTYLRRTLKLSDRLISLVVHSLAMLVKSGNNEGGDVSGEGVSVSAGITALFNHMNSLGRYGKTAFLVPMYGCGELSQAFCRSAAVHGGVFLLRRCPRKIIFSPRKNDEHYSHEQRSLGVSIEGDADPLDDNGECTDGKTKDKVLACQHVVVSEASLRRVKSNSSRIVKRIGIVYQTSGSNSTNSNEDEKRTVLVIPPMTGNIANKNAIQGVVVDHSISVAPTGYSVVYLSTVLETTYVVDDVHVLDRAMRYYLEDCRDNEDTVEEVHHVTFSVLSRENDDLHTKGGCVDEHSPNCFGNDIIDNNNIHVTKLPSHSLTVDAAFEEAKRVFFSIMSVDYEDDNKGEVVEFMKLCSKWTTIRDEMKNSGYGDLDEDEEKANLESALDIIEGNTTAVLEKNIEGVESSNPAVG